MKKALMGFTLIELMVALVAAPAAFAQSQGQLFASITDEAGARTPAADRLHSPRPTGADPKSIPAVRGHMAAAFGHAVPCIHVYPTRCPAARQPRESVEHPRSPEGSVAGGCLERYSHGLDA